MNLYKQKIKTPLGEMVVVSSEDHLYMLEFFDSKNIDSKIKHLQKIAQSEIIPGETSVTKQVTQELEGYYSGGLREFNVAVKFIGTDFQQKVWQQLKQIPFGETVSYLELAKKINHPRSFRAVANSNALNKMAIIIPCHRVINEGGALGGYAGGSDRKQRLLEYEVRQLSS